MTEKNTSMNKDRRKQLIEAIAKLEEAKTLIEIARDEEQDAFDNLPEGLQCGERGQKMEEAISRMGDVIDDIETSVDALNETSD